MMKDCAYDILYCLLVCVCVCVCVKCVGCLFFAMKYFRRRGVKFGGMENGGLFFKQE